MYTPRHFSLDDQDTILSVVRRHPFAVLILETGDGIEIAQVPFIYDPDVGERGRLRCHVAKANPIWKSVETARRATVLFTGPEAYISPDWYATEGLVPTWNYQTVHMRGTPSILDSEETLDVITDLSAQQEADLLPKKPWTLDKVPDDSLRMQRRAIVGIAVAVEAVEAKSKMSQNRSLEDRHGVVEGLRSRGGSGEAVADGMSEYLDA